MENKPRVGLAVLVRKDNKILLGKRKSSHGDGAWAPPGGHLEFMEELEDCVKREVKEETSLKVKNINFGALTNDIFIAENKHYISIYMVCDYESGELQNMEPEKCEQWGWFAWNKLPEPLFLTMQNLLKQHFNPFKNPIRKHKR